ncbi:replication initiator [Microtetraspora sp. AC03309]|uniref:replication initiator n=1 Tax=Microtetraspora sp. AC03309 TaxID=2779376 RepID=UPI0027DFF0D3|nr:replication initiator [Microtetraspora sp. AC03309]
MVSRRVVEEIAKQYGVCIRPIALRRLDTITGELETVDVPCGATLESKCPPCAKRNRQLRMAQCREGWYLDHEPVNTPDEADDYQRHLVELRADASPRSERRTVDRHHGRQPCRGRRGDLPWPLLPPRSAFSAAYPPASLFDGANEISACGLSLNVICQSYPSNA